jgi:hypothetical protein
MTTKATKRKAEAMPSELDDELDDGAMLLDAGVSELLVQLGDTPSEAKVHIYRVRSGIRPPFAFLQELSAGDFNIADVQARYGGGEFLVRVWQKGIPGFKINQRFAIEGEPRTVTPPAPPQAPPTMYQPSPGAAPIILPPGDNGQMIATMMRAMQDGFAQMARAMQARQGGGIEETLRLVALVKQVVGGPAGGDPMGMLKDVLGIVREVQPLTGEGGKADGWSLLQSLAERVLPAIIERSAGGAIQATPTPVEDEFAFLNPPAPLAPATPGPQAFTPTPTPMHNPQPASAPPPQPKAEPMTPEAQFRNAIQFLSAMAATGADPDAYAAMALDAADDETLSAFVNRPDWFAVVCSLAPSAANQSAWWTKLRELILQALNEPEGDEASPEAAHFGGEGLVQ